MKENLPDQIRLTRRDPTRNMARFYVLALQPTLFGAVTLHLSWGRIGARGQEMMETFGGAAAAGLALQKLERTKLRKGYH